MLPGTTVCGFLVSRVSAKSGMGTQGLVMEKPNCIDDLGRRAMFIASEHARGEKNGRVGKFLRFVHPPGWVQNLTHTLRPSQHAPAPPSLAQFRSLFGEFRGLEREAQGPHATNQLLPQSKPITVRETVW